MKQLMLLKYLNHPEIPQVAANKGSLYYFDRVSYGTLQLPTDPIPPGGKWRTDGLWYYSESELLSLNKRL